MSQTINSYKLNPENAKQVGVSTRIQEKGAYKGTFIRAEAVESPQGTLGIEFAFKSDDGRTADYLNVWTVNSQGQSIYGRKVLDALMTVVRQKEISLQRGRIKKWDSKQGKEVETEVDLFPALMGKRLGLLLVREEYEKNDGSTDWKMTIVGCYEADTLKTPREVLEQLPAESLENMIDLLQDRPLKKKKAAPRPAGGNSSGNSSGGGFADMDDDIPF